jgi:hypothetical protein
MAKQPKMNTVAISDALGILSNLSLPDLQRLRVGLDEEFSKRANRHADCLNCHQDFTTKRSWQKYCSRKCRNEHFWKTHTVVETEKQEVNFE